MALSSKQRAEAEVLDLKGKLRQLNKALATKGAVVAENAPLVATIKAVEGMKAVGEKIVLALYKTSQFEGSPDEFLPPLMISDKSPSISIQYAFSGMKALRELPEITGIERANNIQSICKGCASLSSAAIGNMPLATTVGYAFSRCSSIESISIGNVGECSTLEYFSSNCVNLKRLTIGAAPNATSIYCMAEGCVELLELTASFGDKLNSVSYAFSGCKNLIRINGVLNFSGTDNYRNSFASCTSLEEVRIKGVKDDIDLSACAKLSTESVKYLVDNLQQMTGKSITLASAWQTEHPTEARAYAQKATAKGFALTFR